MTNRQTTRTPFLTLLVLGALAASVGCAHTAAVDVTARQAEATAAVNRLTETMEANDAEAFGEEIARDPEMVSFGTDRTERWVGYDTLMDSVRAQLSAFQTTGIDVHDQVVRVHPSGEVAYFSEVIDWTIRAGDQEMALHDVRLTGVLERRDGRWLTTQFHFSKPVDGQAAAY